MVLEPLCVGRQLGGALCGSLVLEVGKAFPAGFHAQRVAIGLCEAIGEIHVALGLLHPEDGVGVEGSQVAGAIVFNQFLDDCHLLVVLGYGLGLLQPVDDAVDGLAVESSAPPHLFAQLSVLLDKAAVHAEHDWMCRVWVRLFHAEIEILGLGLCDVWTIVVGGAGLHEVLPVGLVGALGHDGRVEDDGIEFLHVERQLGRVDILHRTAQEPLGETGLELVAAIVMVNTIGEPYALQIRLEGAEILTLAVTLEVGVYGLQELADAQVIASVLVPKNIPP